MNDIKENYAYYSSKILYDTLLNLHNKKLNSIKKSIENYKNNITSFDESFKLLNEASIDEIDDIEKWMKTTMKKYFKYIDSKNLDLKNDFKSIKLYMKNNEVFSNKVVSIKDNISYQVPLLPDKVKLPKRFIYFGDDTLLDEYDIIMPYRNLNLDYYTKMLYLKTPIFINKGNYVLKNLYPMLEKYINNFNVYTKLILNRIANTLKFIIDLNKDFTKDFDGIMRSPDTKKYGGLDKEEVYTTYRDVVDQLDILTKKLAVYKEACSAILYTSIINVAELIKSISNNIPKDFKIEIRE